MFLCASALFIVLAGSTSGCGLNTVATDDDTSPATELDSAPRAGALGWQNWECTPVDTTYCFAQYEEQYWIECYPTSEYNCWFGSSAVGEGDSCPANNGAECGSCEHAFRECVAPWIARGN